VTALLVFTGRRGLEGHEQIVQPSRAGQSHVERRLQDTRRFAQTAFGVLDREALQKVLGRDTGPTMKEPVKVGFAQTARGGEVAQRGLPRMIFIQVTLATRA